MKQKSKRWVALAAGAHPDDIEIMMAGTLLLLKQAGAEIHMWNLADGCLGSVRHSAVETARIRWQESQDSARLAGAVLHPPLFHDLEIFYDQSCLTRVAAVVRDIQPDIVLTQPPVDYMEDHQNAGRLIVTAVFGRGIPCWLTNPPRPSYDKPVAVYHALPYGLEDWARTPVKPSSYVNISAVYAKKRALLAQHRSQKQWLDASQGVKFLLDEMEELDRRVGALSGRFTLAEGWRLRSHYGFGPIDYNPLKTLLKDNYHEPTPE